ncbi:phospholipase A2 inhibitor and Ly6/PLAUR domain-containing protein-like [Limanda limanda]|uniref:phospholipase A2 inhibitor and Ly6/PLAUR domain-containing protein-like n=1 Tax=Limanda limanda TaxID=27771 RepID=UPI0029C628AA|nr:phospholipase A2 inhibitor and Ly6/PLAUR domain-containing protein-like [Limanda limanda]
MLLLLIFGIVLLPKASTLRCYECTPDALGSCKDTAKQCPSYGYQCGALKVTFYAGASKVNELNMKSCVLAEQCVEGSLNFGVSRTVITSKCCTSDLCNIQPARAPVKSTPNGKKCFRCEGQTCSGTLNCEGNEDRCITTTVDVAGEKITMKGCASQLMCVGSETAQLPGGIGVGLSCCQGDYCNSAISTRAGLLLLVAPLLTWKRYPRVRPMGLWAFSTSELAIAPPPPGGGDLAEMKTREESQYLVGWWVLERDPHPQGPQQAQQEESQEELVVEE